MDSKHKLWMSVTEIHAWVTSYSIVKCPVMPWVWSLVITMSINKSTVSSACGLFLCACQIF